MPLSFPAGTRSQINEIRTAIGRNVTFYTVNKTDCPACELDPISNQSLNSWCPTCSGIGYLTTVSGTSILAHITYAPGEMLKWSVAGQYFDGDCRVQIEYTDINVSVVDHSDYVMIDGSKYDVRKQIPRGVKELNRLLVDCIQRPE
jgi:hypothetical protein